jgi:hypothetical protein
VGVEFHQVFRVCQLENGDICMGLYAYVLKGRDVEDIGIALDMCSCKLLNQTCHRSKIGKTGRVKSSGRGEPPDNGLCHWGLRDFQGGILLFPEVFVYFQDIA